MASDQEYLRFILEQLSEADEITYRPMMGEYLLYYRGRLFGGIYDNRFLVKPVSSALAMMEEAEYETPYEGAGKMLLVKEVDDPLFLKKLLEAMYAELPEPKKKKRKS